MEKVTLPKRAKVASATTFKERMQTEFDELTTKITALVQFIGTDVHMSLPVKEQNLMSQQCDAMRAYARVLVERLK